MRISKVVALPCLLFSSLAWAEVCLYQHNDFRGGRACFDRDVRDFAAIGINDQVSSLKIHGDFEVTLYEESDFRGDSETFEYDAEYVGRRFNDRFSSMEIRHRNEHQGWGRSQQSGWDNSTQYSHREPQGEVCIYWDPNYRGKELCFTRDVTDLTKFNFDNQADSIRIRGDVEAILYEHHHFHGHNRTYAHDTPKFGPDRDTYTSLRIRRRQ